ncbi:MAG: hypothetical protein Q9178_001819 [Gyalolechia marmorata]
MAPAPVSNGLSTSRTFTNGISSPPNEASNGRIHVNGTTDTMRDDSIHANGYLKDDLDRHSSTERPSPICPIALIGLSCKFSGDAANASKFWDLCVAGKDTWGPIPKDRFNAEALFHSDPQRIGRHHVKGGHFLQEDIGLFDAAFFNLSGDVASEMDPQLRLLLESVYEAIENAGIPAEKLSGSNTSVFSGVFARDYFDTTVTDPELLPASFITGNGLAMFSNRVSHFFDLQGASMTIDTGCSTSMVALHQAVRNLQFGESDMSIVGSACALLNPDMFIVMSSQGVLSADGRCYSWDSRASGYGRGEGVGALILKRLDDALRDGDHVHAVIRETAVNQDGKTTTISSPSMEAQQKLIEDCYKRAGLDLAETGYVEAHMTGTLAGDPVEAEALARTFGKHRSSDDPIIVGSCKPNIGHTEPVPTTATSWPQNKPLRASVNNFGYGGTNFHLIMERAPARSLINGSSGRNHDTVDQDGTSRVYIVSSKDSVVTQTSSRQLAAYIRQSVLSRTHSSPADVAYTLAERRSRFPWAVAVKARSLGDLAERLDDPKLKPTRGKRTIPRIGLVFNGQGAQWHAMGRELIDAYPVFGSAILQADKILAEYGATWSLYGWFLQLIARERSCLQDVEELMRDAKFTRVHDTELSQPISVALQLCIVDLLRSWNVIPSAVTSHSSGEIAAAYAVKLLTFKEALGVAYYRGELARKYQKSLSNAGGMLAAGLGAENAEDYLKDLTGGRVVVACVNSSDSVTLSGDLPALDQVAARLEQDGIFARKLKVPLAYHSHHMTAMAKEYADKLSAILPEARGWSGVTFASPVTGSIITSPKVIGPGHWVRNLTNPVLFLQAFESLLSSPRVTDEARPSRQGTYIDLIIEVGAHSTLAGPIKQIAKGRDVEYVSCLRRSTNAVDSMQDVACELLLRGYPLSLQAVNSPFGHTQHSYVHDLPSYAWNHTTRYWSEPRIYKEHRHRPYPPHELLGTLLPGSNRQTPTWRNFLRITDISWLTDHQLESVVVLPGAGYIAMAIEAVRLVTESPDKKIRDYQLRDIDIANALRIPTSSAGIEIQFSLRPRSEKELDHKGWFEFELSSVNANEPWIQHCKGFILAELDNPTTPDVQPESTAPHPNSFFTPGLEVKGVDPKSIFADMRSMNIYHGPAFQNLIDCHTSGNRAITNFHIPAEAQGEYQNYVLHPTTLDAIFQAFYVCVPEETKKDATVVPRSIRSMFVSHLLNRRPGEMLCAYTKLVKAERRGATSDASVVNHGTPNDLACSLQIDGFYSQGVSRARGDEPDDSTPKLCAKTRWELDILQNVPENIGNSWKINLDGAEVSLMKKWRRVSYQFISDAVAKLDRDVTDSWQWHHKLFFSWMKSVVELGKAGKLAPGSQTWSQTSKGIKQRLIDDLAASNAAGRLTCHVGPKLVNIVRGEVTPLELMLEDNLLNKYYEESPRLKDRSYKHLIQIAELYGVKHPGANVLEIGAGTGGATMIFLEGLGARAGGGSGTLLGHYDYTDVSSGFFEAARQKFAAWGDMMDFRKLDVENDPISQSYAPGSYDLIVASMVLHATKNLHKTMTNVRKLLKPGGKLLLLENTQDQIDMHLIFGTLPGWWLSEETDRRMSPNVPTETWNGILRATGFTGVDYEICDCEDAELQTQSIIISTATHESSYPSALSIVYGREQPPQSWSDELTEALQIGLGVTPVVESFENVEVRDDTVYISLMDMARAFLDDMDSRTFEKLRRLLVNSQGVLWLSCSDTIDAKSPIYAQAQGLLRTMKQEDSNKRCIMLDFETTTTPWMTDKIPNVVRVLQQSFNYNDDALEIDREYAVKGSTLHVPRFYPDRDRDRASSESQADAAPNMESFWRSGRDLVWETGHSGMLSDLYFTERHADSENVPDGMVEIEAKAFGLNFRDVMVALNQLDESLIGHDCTGIVKRLGRDTDRSGLKIGDRVCGIAQGRFASVSRAFWTSVVKIPDNLAWEEAASLPIAYGTAYIALMDIARLEKGNRVLIHAATGGVGQAAVMLAKHVGAEVFATCGTKSKRDLLEQKYSIDPDHIFSSRDKSFASAIMARTGGKGVDVVLNSLSGPLLEATWNCIGHFGRFVEIGKVDLEAAKRLNMSPFARSATMTGFDILQYGEYKGKALNRALTKVVDLYNEGSLTSSHPITAYSISDMEKAMRQMQVGSHSGKLVLVPGPDDQVKVVSRPSPLRLDDPKSTYLVTGGLGGIGRAITRWMIDRGAKHILVTSRRGVSDPEAATLLRGAQSRGCNLQIRSCDISDESSLVKLLKDCAGTMPPISGVVQGAMHLDDTVLERMTHDQWKHATLPKVTGSMNLHKHLPELSFFIMLSSLTGVIGNVSQANYAAGNTFQDALARHRTANGQPAITIDLGPVMSVGYVAEGDETLRSRVEKTLGRNVVTIDQLLRLIEDAIRNPLCSSPDESQIVTCLGDYDALAEGSLVKKDPRFRTLQLGRSGAMASGGVTGASSGGMDELMQKLSKATGLEAAELANAVLVNKLAALFNIPTSEVDTSLPLPHYGVDSLVAVELRNWLGSSVKAKVTIFEILQGASIGEFAALVAKRKGN